MYKIILNLFGQHTNILRLSDNANIPCDPNNTDYQAYLKFLDEGNEPLPPDEVTE
jgi:hypothetical protein